MEVYIINRQKLKSLLNIIEVKYETNKWELYGIKIWPLIKKEIEFSKISEFSKSKVVQNRESSPFSINEFKNNVTGEFDFFFVFDPVRLVKDKGKVKNRISGPLAEKLSEQGYRIANIQYENNGSYSNLIFDDNNSMLLTTDYINKFNNKIYLEKNKIENYNEVVKFFNDNNKTSFKFPKFQKIDEIASLVYSLSIEFREVLIKYKVKALFVEIYTHIVSNAWILAANNLNIKTIEIQHGVLNPMLWYCFDNIPSDSYNVMPRIFLTLDDYSFESIKLWTSKTKNTKAYKIENLWVSNYIKTQKKHKESNNKKVLVTLQPQMGTPNWGFNLPYWLVDYIRNSADNTKWYLRYHPLMISNYVKEISKIEKLFTSEIISGKVEIERANNEVLLDLFTQVDLHITAYSYSAVEAALLDVPTIFIHEKAELLFRKYQEFSDLFYYCENKDEFNLSINRNIYENKKKRVKKKKEMNLVNLALKNILSNLNYPVNNELILYNYVDLESNQLWSKLESEQISKEMLVKIIRRLFKMGNFDALIKVYEEKVDFVNLDIAYVVAKVYYNKKLYEYAIDESLNFINKYELTNGNNKEDIYSDKIHFISILYYLGMSYKFIGEYKKAIYWFEKCIKNSELEHIEARKQIRYCKNITQGI